VSNTDTCYSASGEAIARIYNQAIGNGSNLSVRAVWNAFYLHALLRDMENWQGQLAIPHHGLDDDRLTEALKHRNNCMVGIGQEMWAHACLDCTKFIQDVDGSYSRLLPLSVMCINLLYRPSECLCDGWRHPWPSTLQCITVHQCARLLSSTILLSSSFFGHALCNKRLQNHCPPWFSDMCQRATSGT
jgi:hypothetical protein